jgi:hypothetical protein
MPICVCVDGNKYQADWEVAGRLRIDSATIAFTDATVGMYGGGERLWNGAVDFALNGVPAGALWTDLWAADPLNRVNAVLVKAMMDGVYDVEVLVCADYTKPNAREFVSEIRIVLCDTTWSPSDDE